MWQQSSLAAKGATLVAHRAGEVLGGGEVLEGARRLVELGVEMVEVDVRCTRDRVLVIHHDEDVGGALIRAHTYEELVRAGSRLTTLEMFLDVVAGHMALDIELKEPGYEAEALGETLARVDSAQLVMTSFEDSCIATVKRLMPEVSAGLLVGPRSPQRLIGDVFPFARLRACGGDFLAPHYLLLVTGLGTRAKRHGVRLLVWTVNDQRLIDRYLRDPRILGVITDAVEISMGAAKRESGRSRA